MGLQCWRPPAWGEHQRRRQQLASSALVRVRPWAAALLRLVGRHRPDFERSMSAMGGGAAGRNLGRHAATPDRAEGDRWI